VSASGGSAGTTDDRDASSPAADGTAAGLARDVYWAADGASRTSSDLGSVRGRLEAFAERLRREQRQLVPYGETVFGSPAGWKRATKLSVWRLTRFSTMRYDRLLADLAELTAELADRLQASEDEVARLREELARRDEDAS
jgi:hypothetical protein